MLKGDLTVPVPSPTVPSPTVPVPSPTVPVPDRATAGQVTIWHCAARRGASGNLPLLAQSGRISITYPSAAKSTS